MNCRSALLFFLFQIIGSYSMAQAQVVKLEPQRAAAPTKDSVAAARAQYPADVLARCPQGVVQGYDCLATELAAYNQRKKEEEERRKKEAEEKKQQMMQALQQALSSLGGGGGGGDKKGQGQQGSGNQAGAQSGNSQSPGSDSSSSGTPLKNNDSGSAENPAGRPPGESPDVSKSVEGDKKSDDVSNGPAKPCPEERRGPKKMMGLGKESEGLAVEPLISDPVGSRISYKAGTEIYAPGGGLIQNVESKGGFCKFNVVKLKCPGAGDKDCAASVEIPGECPSKISEGVEVTACDSLGKIKGGSAYLQVRKPKGPGVGEPDDELTRSLSSGIAPIRGFRGRN